MTQPRDRSRAARRPPRSSSSRGRAVIHERGPRLLPPVRELYHRRCRSRGRSSASSALTVTWRPRRALHRSRQHDPTEFAARHGRRARALDAPPVDRGGTWYTEHPPIVPLYRVPVDRPRAQAVYSAAHGGRRTPPPRAAETGRAPLFASRAITAHRATGRPRAARLRIDPCRRPDGRPTRARLPASSPWRVEPGTRSRYWGRDPLREAVAGARRGGDGLASGVARRPPAGRARPSRPGARRGPRDGWLRRRRDGDAPIDLGAGEGSKPRGSSGSADRNVQPLV